jgi:hypothetical protein
VVSAFVFVTYGGGTGDDRVPGFWLAVFLVGGPISLFIGGMLISIRRSDRSRFQKLDWMAIGITALGAVLCAAILLSMYLRTRSLNRDEPKTRSLRQSPPWPPEPTPAFPLPESGRTLHALSKSWRAAEPKTHNPKPRPTFPVSSLRFQVSPSLLRAAVGELERSRVIFCE